MPTVDVCKQQVKVNDWVVGWRKGEMFSGKVIEITKASSVRILLVLDCYKRDKILLSWNKFIKCEPTVQQLEAYDKLLRLKL